jgi:hypothetical protein
MVRSAKHVSNHKANNVSSFETALCAPPQDEGFP